MKKPSLDLFTKRMLDIMFQMGILLTLSIPLLFRWAGIYAESFRRFYLPQTILYMMSGVLSLRIVQKLRQMFSTVLADDAFVDENADALKCMGKCSFLIALLSLVRIFYAPTPATIVVIIVFAIAGLVSIVLCQVFEKAIQYKKENDLTI